jgi:hypothetical protein
LDITRLGRRCNGLRLDRLFARARMRPPSAAAGRRPGRAVAKVQRDVADPDVDMEAVGVVVVAVLARLETARTTARSRESCTL